MLPHEHKILSNRKIYLPFLKFCTQTKMNLHNVNVCHEKELLILFGVGGDPSQCMTDAKARDKPADTHQI
jgi:hypothetical protein